jgi:hypothetical protein
MRQSGRPAAEAKKVEGQLKELGADHVFTYKELEDKQFPQRVRELIGDKVRFPRSHCLLSWVSDLRAADTPFS